MNPEIPDLELDDNIEDSGISYEELNEIPRLKGSDISYSKFFGSFLLKNKPGIITDATADWSCGKCWVTNNTLNVDYFIENYGDEEISVSNCGRRWYNVQEKCNMVMRDYLSYWEKYRKDAGGMDCLYLKDWHYAKQYPKETMYRVPCYFASDWLNEYYDMNTHLNDDFRFVYVGPKRSWTPFHSDVLSSFSWSANICGRKRWILLPPGDENHFRDELGHLKYNLDESENDTENKAKVYEIIQEKGEVIFVPSGWYHQVWNLEDAVSVNHNWINACNILHVWEALKSSLKEVKREISDFENAENWNEDCQKLLHASFGFDYYRFYGFLKQIAESRMDKLRSRQSLTVYGGWSIGRRHMIFDLKRILKVIKAQIDDSDFRGLRFANCDDCPEKFRHALENFLLCEV